MGYRTELSGELAISRGGRAAALPQWLGDYLRAFSETRHCRCHGQELSKWMADPEERYHRKSPHAEPNDWRMPDGYNDVTDGMPGLWCPWTVSQDNSKVVWNGWEKPYGIREWLEYFIGTFLAPLGYGLDGEVEWRGEDGDGGTLEVRRNEVSGTAPCW